jgi:hypothetical protein
MKMTPPVQQPLSGRLVQGSTVRTEERVLEGKLRGDPGQEYPLAGATEEIEPCGDIEVGGAVLTEGNEGGPSGMAHHRHLDRCQGTFLVAPSFS